MVGRAPHAAPAAAFGAAGDRPARRGRAAGEEVGLVSLDLTAAAEHELGWWIAPGRWGRGYASEAALAVLTEAFTRVGAPHLIAQVRPANTASLRVAEHLGMRETSRTADLVVLRVSGSPRSPSRRR